MEIKIVKKPVQTIHTKIENLEYVEFITENNQLKKIIPTWCVKNYIYRGSNGGMDLWFQTLERIKPDIIYLYEIKRELDDLDIIYSISADLKKVSTKINENGFVTNISDLNEIEIVDNNNNIKKDEWITYGNGRMYNKKQLKDAWNNLYSNNIKISHP